MRKLVLKMSISIDGFVGGPDGEVEWIFPTIDDRATEWLIDTLWDASLHIMGSRTFQGMKAWWPQSDEPYAAPMNVIPKACFSRGGAAGTAARRGLDDVMPLDPHQAPMQGWEQAPILTGDLATEIQALKAQEGKPVLAHGGAGFARSLIPTGLIDEYRLLQHPIALGTGLAIFSGLAAPLDLILVGTERFPSGAIANSYRPARFE